MTIISLMQFAICLFVCKVCISIRLFVYVLRCGLHMVDRMSICELLCHSQRYSECVNRDYVVYKPVSIIIWVYFNDNKVYISTKIARWFLLKYLNTHICVKIYIVNTKVKQRDVMTSESQKCSRTFSED